MASGVTAAAAAAAAAAPTGLVVTFNNPLETFLLLDAETRAFVPAPLLDARSGACHSAS